MVVCSDMWYFVERYGSLCRYAILFERGLAVCADVVFFYRERHGTLCRYVALCRETCMVICADIWYFVKRQGNVCKMQICGTLSIGKVICAKCRCVVLCREALLFVESCGVQTVFQHHRCRCVYLKHDGAASVPECV